MRRSELAEEDVFVTSFDAVSRDAVEGAVGVKNAPSMARERAAKAPKRETKRHGGRLKGASSKLRGHVKAVHSRLRRRWPLALGVAFCVAVATALVFTVFTLVSSVVATGVDTMRIESFTGGSPVGTHTVAVQLRDGEGRVYVCVRDAETLSVTLRDADGGVVANGEGAETDAGLAVTVPVTAQALRSGETVEIDCGDLDTTSLEREYMEFRAKALGLEVEEDVWS